MLLIKSKIYFSEITQNQKSIYTKHYLFCCDYFYHKKSHIDINRFFILSGYSRLVYYGLKNLLNSGKIYELDLFGAMSGKLDVFKFVWKNMSYSIQNVQKVLEYLQNRYHPDVLDFLLSQNNTYTCTEYFKIPSIFNYFCARKTNVIFRSQIVLLIPAKFQESSHVCTGNVLYRCIGEKFVKRGYY